MNIVELYKLSFDYLFTRLGPGVYQFENTKPFQKNRETFTSDGWSNCFTLFNHDAKEIGVYVGDRKLSPITDYTIPILSTCMIVMNHHIKLSMGDIITIEYLTIPKLERRGL